MSKSDRKMLCRCAARIAKLVDIDAPAIIVLADLALLVNLLVEYTRDDQSDSIARILELTRQLKETT
jgi:hypothetical protein